MSERAPEQVANLMELAEVMETIASPEFEGLVGLGLVEFSAPECGTYRCVIGWYNKLTGEDVRFHACEELNHFGITDEQSDVLFGGFGIYEWESNVSFPEEADYDPDATRREVTARRDYLVHEILGGDAR